MDIRASGIPTARKLDAARTVRFFSTIDAHHKPIAVICHGPWLLVSTGLVQGRRLTSYHTIRDDIRNAGGIWEDREVIQDRNWVSSRQPTDLPAFHREMLTLFAEARGQGETQRGIAREEESPAL